MRFALPARELAVDGGDELSSDVDVELTIEFTNSRGTRHVDLGEVVANDVEPREQHAFRRQGWAHLLAEPAIANRERATLTPGAHDEIAAALAGSRDTRQRVLDRLAVDEQHAL